MYRYTSATLRSSIFAYIVLPGAQNCPHLSDTDMLKRMVLAVEPISARTSQGDLETNYI